MPLPENFNSVHHLKQVLLKTRNKLVQDYFRGDVDENDLATNEGALKRACLIDDDDTIDIINLKTNFFLYDVGAIKTIIADSVYGVPKIDFQRNIRFKPQVILNFKEPYKEAKARNRTRSPKRMWFSFRIMEKTENITNADVIRLSNEIKSKLAKYKYFCGYNSMSYRDSDNGLELNIRYQQKSDVIELLKKICDIANVTYNAKHARKHEPEIIDTTPNNVMILGENKKEQTIAIGNVILAKAVLELHGGLQTIHLYP